MRFTVLVVFAVVVVIGVWAQDECMPPKPGEKHVHPPDCCKLEGIGGILPDTMKSAAEKCREKYPHPPHPPRPSGPPTGPPPPPTPEMKNHHACMVECVFAEAGLVKGGKIDKEAVMKSFTSENKELGTTITSAVEKCFTTFEKDVDTSLECKSGAMQLEKCVMREVFLDCPSSMWNDSADCTALKNKVGKCPGMPIMLGPHHGPRGPPPH